MHLQVGPLAFPCGPWIYTPPVLPGGCPVAAGARVTPAYDLIVPMISTGNIIILSVTCWFTISTIKDQLAAGLDARFQIFFKGELLEDDRTLEDYNIGQNKGVTARVMRSNDRGWF